MKYLLNCTGKPLDPKNKGQLYQFCSNNILPFNTDNEVWQYPHLRIYCDGCKHNVTKVVSIAVAYLDYCVDCFSNLSTYPEQYRVRAALNGSIYEDTLWSTFDELLLLFGCKEWGLGNWAQIKQYMDINGSYYSTNQIEQHYEMYYVKHEQIIPINNKLSLITIASKEIHKNSNQDLNYYNEYNNKQKFPQNQKNENISNQKQDNEYNNNNKKKIIKQKVDNKNLQKIRKNNKQINYNSNILGYNQKRLEFEIIQYQPQAQSMLAYLEFQQNDNQQQKKYKIKIIQDYNKIINQRYKRKQFVIQHKLLDSHYQLNQKVNKYKKQNYIFDSFKPFLKFNNYQQTQQIKKISQNNIKYRKILETMLRGRKIKRNGKIKSLLEILQEKRDKKQEEKNNKKQKNNHNKDNHNNNKQDNNKIKDKLMKHIQPRKIYHIDPISKTITKSKLQTNLKDEQQQDILDKCKIDNNQIENISKNNLKLAPSEIDYLQKRIQKENNFYLSGYKIYKLESLHDNYH